MATLQTILDRVRFKARDEQGVELTDPLALSFTNGILESIHQHLVNVESNLVYAQENVSLVSGQAEYSLSAEHDGILKDGVWMEDGQVPLSYVNEPDLVALGYDPTSTWSEPLRYYLATGNKIGFHPAPNDEADGATVKVLYWRALTELSDVSEDLPWNGIWDRVVEYWLLFDFLERRESDTTRVAALLDLLEGEHDPD